MLPPGLLTICLRPCLQAADSIRLTLVSLVEAGRGMAPLRPHTHSLAAEDGNGVGHGDGDVAMAMACRAQHNGQKEDASQVPPVRGQKEWGQVGWVAIRVPWGGKCNYSTMQFSQRARGAEAGNPLHATRTQATRKPKSITSTVGAVRGAELRLQSS